MPLGNTQTYDMNLKALRSRQPRVAQCIDETELPRASQTATARDGTCSATYLTPDGTRVWLGRSSMPQVSTAAQLDGSVFGPGNVATPGILTGIEPLALLTRLSREFAVFVIEKELAFVKLAMHVHDYVAAIESGRLVVIPEYRFDQAFTDFFSDQPGYEMPLHLLSTVHRDPTETKNLQQRLEGVAQRIAEIHQESARAATKTYVQARGDSLSESVRLAVLSIDTSQEIERLSKLIVDAGNEIGWTVDRCVPNAPDMCHTVARLQAAANARANLILFLGGGSALLRQLLPASVPMVTWLLPSSPLRSDLAPAVELGDIVCAASRHVRNQLELIGVPSERIQDLPLAVTTTRSSTIRPPSESKRMRITAFATLPPTSAPACGIGLPSHVTFWNKLVQSTLEDARKRRVLDLDSLFQRTQRQHSVLDDASVLARLRDAASSHLIPVAETVSSLCEVTASGYDLAIYGTDLRTVMPDAEYRGAIPSIDTLSEVLEWTDALLLPHANTNAMTWSLSALVCGTAVLARPDNSFNLQCSELLRTPLRALHWFENVQELRKLLTALKTDAPGWRTAHAAGVHDLCKHHGLTARLAQILGFVLASANNSPSLASTKPKTADCGEPSP